MLEAASILLIFDLTKDLKFKVHEQFLEAG